MSCGSSRIEPEVSMRKWMFGGVPSESRRSAARAASLPYTTSWMSEVVSWQQAGLSE